MLEGSLAVTLETEKIELEAGDSVHFDANQAYCLQGREDSPCVVIWCSSPPRSDLEQKIAAVLDENAGISVTAEIS